MGRPPLDIGTYGRIRTTPLPAGNWRSATLYRDADGVTRPVRRVGATAAKAERALKGALTKRQRRGVGDLTRESPFAECAELWLASVKRRRRGTTYDRYRTRLRNKVIPAFGRLRLREITTGRVDAYLEELERRLKPGTVRTYRTVLSGTMGYAVRMDAIERNPVREAAHIEGKGKQSRALTKAEREDLLAKVDADDRAVEDDLPDVFRYLIGTGVRIGELLALRWFRVDLDEGVVVHGDSLAVETGVGVVLHEPKTLAGFRVLPLPDFVLLMLQLRYPGEAYALGPVFPNALGTWRHPSSSGRSVRKFRDEAGYPWFTAHACRHTAATVLDEQGLTGRDIAGYIGHANPAFTQRVYMDRRVQDRRASSALDSAMRPAR